jgi:cytoskeletal protein RodZ
MKPWKIVSIIAVVVVLGVGVLIAFGGMGVKKKPQQAKQQQTTQSSKKKEEVKQETQPSSSSTNSSSQASSSKTEENKPSETKPSASGEPKKTESDTYALANVDFPTFKVNGSSRAVVSGKKVYKLGTSYVFNVVLTVPTESNGNMEVDYLTTFNNYNSVKIGSLVSVEYGISADGSITITSAKPI